MSSRSGLHAPTTGQPARRSRRLRRSGLAMLMLSGLAGLPALAPAQSSQTIQVPGDLDGSNGFAMRGASHYEHAGQVVSPAGDVNGDGIDDFLICGPDWLNYSRGARDSAPGSWRAKTRRPAAEPRGTIPGYTYAGIAHVVFGDGGGFPAQVELSGLDGSNGFSIFGDAPGQYTGYGAAAVGDVNGDDIEDFAIGTDFAAFIIFGRTTPFPSSFSVSDLSTLGGVVPFFVCPTPDGAVKVAGAGDFDGDGFDDVLVGVSNYDTVYLLRGGSAGRQIFGRACKGVDRLSSPDVMVIRGTPDSYGGDLGLAMDGAGDFNGDGYDDIVLGEPYAYPVITKDAGGAPPCPAGRAYVILGRTTSSVPFFMDLSALAPGDGMTITGYCGNSLGYSVAGLGDFDGDGFDDIAFNFLYGGGPRGRRGLASGDGLAMVALGSSGPLPPFTSPEALYSYDQGQVFYNDSSYSMLLGACVAGAGDVNGDGMGDLLLGNIEAYVPRGSSYDGVPEAILIHGGVVTGGSFTGAASAANGGGFLVETVDGADSGIGNQFAAGIGDINDDGLDDILLGSIRSFEEIRSHDARGGGYVIFGSVPCVTECDTYALDENGSLDVAAPGVLSNDQASGTVYQITAPCHGSLTLNADGSFTYTPDADFVGIDGAGYIVSCGGVVSEYTAIFFDVIEPNAIPVVDVNAGLMLTLGTTADITSSLLFTSDANNTADELTYTVLSGPAEGALSLGPAFTQQDIDNGLLNYTSTGGTAPVSDSFDFVVDDPFGDDTGVQTFNIQIVPPVPPQTATFSSIGPEDGWVRENGATSEKGGSSSSVAQLAGVGDTVANEQYMLIYSFDTSSLPPGATVAGGRLTVRRVGIQADPSNLGPLEVDVMKGFFGTTALVEPADFQFPATAPDAGSMAYPAANLDYTTVNFGPAGINPLGRTQVRVRFDLPDNGNLLYDYLLLGMAEHRTVASRPVLEVDYFPAAPPPQVPGKTGTKIEK